MATDAQEAAAFYATARGAVAARLLRTQLAAMWPAQAMAGRTLLGLGHATPFLRLWRDRARRTVQLTPARSGAVRWPRGAPCLSCLAEEQALPFADASVDRVLLVHGLEAAESTRAMLREVWRVLAEDGQMLVVAPNRHGLWAHVESTPFGQGQPFSSAQIGRLLNGAMFRVVRREGALFMPPAESRLVLRSARLWESTGRRLVPGLAGVIVAEAVKDVYAGVVTGTQQVRRRIVLAEAA